MSKITLDNLSDNLKEYLEGLGLSEEQVLNLINENGLDEEELKAMLKDTMSIDELSTNSKTVIGAINELFQSANNGKELIASAIGEPVSSEDTFSAMSNDINGLLSTFKTNMMNNGVTVESSDRFKSLIDKIATLADNEGKGIQYASGQISAPQRYTFANVYATHTFNFDEPLNFTPTYLFIRIPDVRYSSSNGNGEAINAIVSNLFNDIYNSTDWANQFRVGCVSSEGVLNIKSVSASGFVMEGDTDITFGYATSSDYYGTDDVIDWYAIGIGEEDTTLRDSLASILEEEGVSVTEEDDMASLITKVDEEFDNKNTEIENSGGLDIICATELPNEVVNNQVCLITESFGKVYVANELSTSVLNEGDVYIMTTTTGYYATTHMISPVNDISLNLSRVVQIKNGIEEKIDGYVGINGQWVPTDSLEFYLFKQGTGLHSSVGGFNITESDGTYSISNDVISLTGYAEFGDITIQSKNKIDLTEYTKLEVNSESSGYGGFTLSVGDSSLYLSEDASEPAVLDISSINGLQYIEITKGSNYQNQSGYIYYIKLIKEFE